MHIALVSMRTTPLKIAVLVSVAIAFLTSNTESAYGQQPCDISRFQSVSTFNAVINGTAQITQMIQLGAPGNPPFYFVNDSSQQSVNLTFQLGGGSGLEWGASTRFGHL